ncbi:MAG: M56 family metallopeptidase, partial [Planctomycetaceae bacterium]|nr:M56 family metallopeptidase [Planctomycetaceae bacterium]
MERILTPVGWNLLFAGVLAIVAWGGGRWSVLRRRPKFLYGLWLLVLVKLVAPPLIALPILQPEVIPESAPVEWSPAQVVVPVILEQLPTVVVPAEPPPQFQLTDYFREPRFWLFVIVVTSLCVTLTLWGRTCFQIRRWQRLLDQVPGGEERFKKLAETAAERMGLKLVPEVRLVEGELTPFLWTGGQKFSIVLPVTLAEQLTDEQVLCILMHELAHYRRRDHWGHAFAGFVTSLFWWNPVSWWAWRELRGLQEICCDALVLQFSAESRRLYAETLYTVLETLQTGKSVQPALSCSFGDSQHLRRRFTMLADTKLTPGLSPMMVCALLGIAALIPCLPTRAEPVE